MGKLVTCAAHVIVAAALVGPVASARAEPPSSEGHRGFPVLPLPPAIDGLIAFPQTYTVGRRAYLGLITAEAEQRGLPAAIADAVARVESGFNPNAVGGVGEIGLMQIRPQTAAMLGFKGGLTSLFEPETNVRFGVAYLARAWELAKGDVCRTLMKYRAGWGEERMTPLSVEYCRRARGHLAAIGSPLAQGALPISAEPTAPFAARQPNPIKQASLAGESRSSPATASQVASAKMQRTERGPADARPARIRVASVGEVKISEAQAEVLRRSREQDRIRAEKRRQIWAEHNSRMDAITAKLKKPQLTIMSSGS